MSKSFTYRDKYNWIRLYKVYVRPNLEYAVQVWSLRNQKDIDLLEDVQKRVVRMTAGLKPGTYQDKLKELGLPSLEERRIRGDKPGKYCTSMMVFVKKKNLVYQVKFSLNSEHKVELISIQPGDEESKPGNNKKIVFYSSCKRQKPGVYDHICF